MTEETNNLRNKQRPNRVLRIIRNAVIGLLALIVLFFMTVFIVDRIMNKTDQAKIHPYGQSVVVDGKKMYVSIEGDGEETIVLLPGYGTAGPALDFKPLIDQLSPHYKVVAVEPFGYGLSDQTDKERTTANIVEEIHAAVQQLGLTRYILMGHSIAGLYGVDYANKYTDEVQAFVGIDSSVPKQPGMDTKMPTTLFAFLKKSGLLRPLIALGGSPYMTPPYDETTKKQLQLLSYRNSNADTMLNELKHLASNFANGYSMTFPAEIPVLLFIQEDNRTVEGWTSLHEEQANSVNNGKVVPLEGDHYLHHTKYKEIAEEVQAFFQ